MVPSWALPDMQDDRSYYVYLLIDPRDSSIFYVGKGKGRRCFNHLYEARSTNKNSPKLQKIRKIESLGLDVVIKKVEENVTDSQAQELECLIISEARNKGIALTNLTAGGDGSSGYKHTEEAKQKIKESQLGKVVSEETKAKLSKHFRENNQMCDPEIIAKRSGENHWAYGLIGEEHPSYGRKDTPEQIEAKRQRMLGKKRGPCSDQQRENIRKATTGVKKSNTENMKKPRSRVVCPHCGKEGGSNTMNRWHFDNCKENPNAEE